MIQLLMLTLLFNNKWIRVLFVKLSWHWQSLAYRRGHAKPESDTTAITHMKLKHAVIPQGNISIFLCISGAGDPVACQWTGLNMHDKWWCPGGGM